MFQNINIGFFRRLPMLLTLADILNQIKYLNIHQFKIRLKRKKM